MLLRWCILTLSMSILCSSCGFHVDISAVWAHFTMAKNEAKARCRRTLIVNRMQHLDTEFNYPNLVTETLFLWNELFCHCLKLFWKPACHISSSLNWFGDTISIWFKALLIETCCPGRLLGGLPFFIFLLFSWLLSTASMWSDVTLWRQVWDKS